MRCNFSDKFGNSCLRIIGHPGNHIIKGGLKYDGKTHERKIRIENSQ